MQRLGGRRGLRLFSSCYCSFWLPSEPWLQAKDCVMVLSANGSISGRPDDACLDFAECCSVAMAISDDLNWLQNLCLDIVHDPAYGLLQRLNHRCLD